MSTPAPEANGPASPWRAPRWAISVAKLAVTTVALGWAISRTSFSAMLGAVRSLSAHAFLLSVGILLVNVVVGGFRWRSVIKAYPGANAPSLRFLSHGYLVAGFYNTFVPGNIGGDALRAHAARRAFEHPTDSYATIAIERGLGLAALFVLSGVGIALRGGSPWTGPLLAVGGGVLAVTAAEAPALSRWFLRFLPEKLKVKVPALSVPTGRADLGLAFLWSVVSQYMGMLSTHALVRDLVPSVTVLDSLAIVPIAMASLYIPVSVAGLGVREAAFVVLFAHAGVSPANATAASLATMATQMTVALLGGIAHAFFPLSLPLASSPEGADAARARP